jgi:hypothetical protein
MPVKGINCASIVLQKTGTSRCETTKRPWFYPSPCVERECGRFIPAVPEAVAKRVAQLKAIGGNPSV